MRPVEHVVFDGQSLIFAPAAGRGLAALVMDQLPPTSWSIVGLSGTTYATRATTVTARTDQHVVNAETPVLVDVGGQSDLLADLTAAQLLTAAESYANGRRTAGFDRIIGCTVPHSTQFSAGQNTQRLAYNPLLLASSAFDTVADLAAVPALQDASNTTYYSDGLHFTAAGAALAAAVIVAALEAA